MVASRAAPGALSELHLWLATSERLADDLGPLCRADVLAPGDWEERAADGAALLLVEAASPWEAAYGQLDRLLDAGDSAGIPALLWVTGGRLEPGWMERCGRFERAFTVDGGQLPQLRAAGAREPRILWPGASSPLGERVERWGLQAGDRPDPVLWLGGWSLDWPPAWRDRLAAVLRAAAPRGLRILPVADLDDLPPDLAPCVDAAAAGEDGGAALRLAKVAIGADPLHGAPEMAPAIAFAAAAAGAAPITPHAFLSFHDFAVGGDAGAPWRNLLPIVGDEEIAAREIDSLLEDDTLRSEVVQHLRRIVANNHTHAHRLATLASAAGLRLVPDARDPAPA